MYGYSTRFLFAGTILALMPAGMVCAQAVLQTRSMLADQGGRFIEAPRIIQQQLREAERALEDERYSDAVVRLGDLLAEDAQVQRDEDLAGQDFFLEVDQVRPGGPPLNKSLLRTARERIANLPGQAMETYRLRYGPLARKLLVEAAEARDWYQVREVRRRYFHTDAGYEASALLAQKEFYNGHPLAASLLLDEVAATPRAIEHLGREVVLFHAAACKLADRSLPGIASIAGQSISVGGETTAAPSPDELSDWLTDRLPSNIDLPTDMNQDYPMFGTSPARNGGLAGQLPLTNKRWDLVTTASSRQERDVRQAAEAMAASGRVPPPSWIPIRIGNHLLMRTTERLVGVDYRTGKRVWTYPWQTASEELDQDEQALDTLADEEALAELLRQRVWNDIPYGQITSDGDRVFMLDSLQKVELLPFGGLNLRGMRPADGRSNTLVALDLATEGKLLWRLGADVDDGTELSSAFFLGPPLPLDGRLYVIAELSGDIILLCLEPATGNEIWRQQLVAVESGGIETDAIRRIAGAMPTYQSGILVCPTGAGALVAIDLADRMIRWGVTYNRNKGINQIMAQRNRRFSDTELLQRWYSGAAVVADQTVLITPIESDRLLGLDLLTGKKRFPVQNRVQMRYLAGARDGKFLIVGNDQVRAEDIRSGRTLWNTPSSMLKPGQYISGIGVFGDGEYLLPTSTNEMIRVSLEDGSVRGRRRTRYSLGNLVAAGGEIISQGATKLSVAYGEQSLEPLVDQMLSENPEDLDALIRKSELLIQRGERRSALDLLDRARAMDEENDEIRMLYVSAMLGQLKESPELDDELISRLDSQIDRPMQRVEFLTLLVRSSLQQKDFVTAVDRLLELATLVQANPLLEPSVKEISEQPGRQTALDVWIAARLAEIAASASPEQRDQINRNLVAYAERERHESTGYLEQIVSLFSRWDGIGAMRQELTQRHREDKSYLKLERLSLGQRSPTEQSLADWANDRLVSLAITYAEGGMPKDALRLLDLLESRGESAIDGISVDLMEQIRQDTKPENQVWPEKASLNWETRQSPIRNIPYRRKPSATQVQAGKQFEGWMLISDAANTIALRDPNGFVRRVPAERTHQLDGSDKQAHICGGFMAVMTTGGLIGVDLFELNSGASNLVLWNRQFDGRSNGPLARSRTETTPFDDPIIRYYITSGVAVAHPPELKLGPIVGDRLFVLRGGELLAIQTLNSETLWRNSDAPTSGVILCDDQRVAVVSPESERVDFFDLMDGRKLSSRPWTMGEVWAAGGRHVLAYQTSANRRVELQLIDPFVDQVVLRHETFGANRKPIDLPCAYGRVVDGSCLAMLASDGQLLVWDLIAGREISKTKVDAIPDLQGLEVMKLDGKIIMMPRRRYEQSRTPEAEILQTRAGKNHRMVHAAYAVSLSGGDVLWQQSFEKPWGCTLTQPSATPLVMFTRSFTRNVVGSNRKAMEVLALDVRTGKELHPARRRPIKSNVNELETRLVVQPADLQVIANIGSEILRYRFEEAP